MDDDTFNMQTRKFLKKVGINAQRAIETAVREGVENGSLTGSETLNATVLLKVDGVDLEISIDDTIALE